MTNVRQVDHALDDLRQLGTRLREQQFDVVHHLVSLSGGIADTDILARLQILRDLATQVDDTVGHDCLTEVVREVLLRIGLLRIEGPNTFVNGHALPSCGARSIIDCS